MDNENFWEQKHLNDDLDSANKEAELLKKQNKILIDALKYIAKPKIGRAKDQIKANEALAKVEATHETK